MSDDSAWGVSGDVYHDHTETNNGSTDAYGASVDVSYPDGPWGSGGELSVGGEVDHDVSHEISGGTLSESGGWSGDVSVDY